MRKMKKINGYLVVKFNARELREYEGTALGEYGVIDAELYGFECVSLLCFKGEVILRLVSDGVKTVTNLRPALSYWEAGASLQCGYKPAS